MSVGVLSGTCTSFPGVLRYRGEGQSGSSRERSVAVSGTWSLWALCLLEGLEADSLLARFWGGAPRQLLSEVRSARWWRRVRGRTGLLEPACLRPLQEAPRPLPARALTRSSVSYAQTLHCCRSFTLSSMTFPIALKNWGATFPLRPHTRAPSELPLLSPSLLPAFGRQSGCGRAGSLERGHWETQWKAQVAAGTAAAGRG